VAEYTPETCPCVLAERPVCDPKCWHYTATAKAERCKHCGQPPTDLDVEETGR
jgi:hypothetical protein